MPIPIRCPKCQTKGEAANQLAGETCKCRQCGALVEIPDGNVAILGRICLASETTAFRSGWLLFVAWLILIIEAVSCSGGFIP